MNEENSKTQPIYNEEEFIEAPSLNLPWRFIIFSFLIFLVTILMYFGLKFGYLNYLNGQISDLDKNLNELVGSIDEIEREKLISFYSQLVNLENISQNHIYVSKIFKFLEDNTLSKVMYNNFQFNAEKNVIFLNGSASDLNYLASQVNLFEKNKNVFYVNLGNLKFYENKVFFDLELGFVSDYLK